MIKSNFGTIEINYRIQYAQYGTKESFDIMTKFEEGIAKYAEELLNKLNSESKDVKLQFTTQEEIE
jgi:hypothetical protein